MILTRRCFVQAISIFLASGAVLRADPVVATPPRELALSHLAMTRLEHFLRARGINPAALARESGYSRELLLRLRMGRIEPTPACMEALIRACRRLSREAVQRNDLFLLEGRHV